MHHFSNYAINEIVYNFCANFLLVIVLFYIFAKIGVYVKQHKRKY